MPWMEIVTGVLAFLNSPAGNAIVAALAKTIEGNPKVGEAVVAHAIALTTPATGLPVGVLSGLATVRESKA